MRLLILILAAIAYGSEAQFTHWRDLANADTTNNGDAIVHIIGPPWMIIKDCTQAEVRFNLGDSGKLDLIIPKGRLLYISFICAGDYIFTTASSNALLVQYQIYGIFTGTDQTIIVSQVKRGG